MDRQLSQRVPGSSAESFGRSSKNFHVMLTEVTYQLSSEHHAFLVDKHIVVQPSKTGAAVSLQF